MVFINLCFKWFWQRKTMTTTTTLSGITGILRPFKEYMRDKNLPEGSQIAYYGCGGLCTPFIELLAHATRSLNLTHLFVPHFNEADARLLRNVPEIGMQVGERADLNPAVIVLMGGLAMPGMPSTIEEAQAVISRHGVPVAGVCFQSMFEKSGWLTEISFDLLIDARIDPVTITRKE